jgi:hypothetical protein
MQRVGEHPVPAGPLSVRWLAHEVAPARAGAFVPTRLALENAGSAVWHGLRLAYHWLDPLGNPIVWDGMRTDLPDVDPGAALELDVTVRAAIPPGGYRLAFDLVLEDRFWLAELGNTQLTLDTPVAPRIERALAVRGADVTGQEEPVVAESDAAAIAYLTPVCRPAPDWSRRILDAHQEGYGIVGSSIDAGRNAALAPWTPGPGRNPSFRGLLLCPSVVVGVQPDWQDDVEGLPALDPPPRELWLHHEPWLYDAAATISLPRGKRRASP